MPDYGRWDTEELKKEARDRVVIVGHDKLERDELQAALKLDDITGMVFKWVYRLITINILAWIGIFLLAGPTYAFGIDLYWARLYAAATMLLLSLLGFFPVAFLERREEDLKESLAKAVEIK